MCFACFRDFLTSRKAQLMAPSNAVKRTACISGCVKKFTISPLDQMELTLDSWRFSLLIILLGTTARSAFGSFIIGVENLFSHHMAKSEKKSFLPPKIQITAATAM
jgi:hypothetical protein